MKTQQAYEDILKQKKQREERQKLIDRQPMVEEVKGVVEARLPPKGSKERTLEKELGFSSSDSTPSSKSKTDEELDELSNTSDDDFEPNKIIKQASRKQLELVDPEVTSQAKTPRVIKQDNDDTEPERQLPVKENMNPLRDTHKPIETPTEIITPKNPLKQSQEFMEDTMCKLVEFLDYSESEEERDQNFTKRDKPVREIEVEAKQALETDINKSFEEDKPRHIIKKLENAQYTASKEHTFGQTVNSNVETIQVHNLKNYKKEEERRTERKIQCEALVTSTNKIASNTIHQLDNINPSTTKASNKAQFDNTLASQAELTQKKLPKFTSVTKEISPISSRARRDSVINNKKGDLEDLIQDSELYFNAVLSKMNEDLNPNTVNMPIDPPKSKPGRIKSNRSGTSSRQSTTPNLD